MPEDLYAKYGVSPPEGYEERRAQEQQRQLAPQWLTTVEWLATIHGNMRGLEMLLWAILAMLVLILWRVW